MYPFVVIRYLATVYGQFPVRFVADHTTDLAQGDSDRAFVVVYSRPYTADEKLTPQARKAVIDVVQHASRKSGHRGGVVFADDDCVYTEPEGTAKPSAEPPSGGIQCLLFPIRLKDDG